MKANVFATIYELTHDKIAKNIHPPHVPWIEIYQKLCPLGYSAELIQRELNSELKAGRIGKHRGINGDIYFIE